MKKNKLLYLFPLTALLLAGCSLEDLMFWKQKNPGNYKINPTIDGGTTEEKEAILNVINSKPICNKSGNAVTEILPDVTPQLLEDEGDDVMLTTRQIAKNKKFVDITWSVPEGQIYYSKISDLDDVHKLLEINYQHYGAPNGELTWNISKLVCGGAVCNNPKEMTYKATIVNEEYLHDDVRIADINKVTDEELIVDAGGETHKFASTFDNVDYEYHEGVTYFPRFKTNNPNGEKKFLYYNVPGKVIYTAPDGNWGLLADGAQVLEFYIGAGKALTPTNWPNLEKEYVVMSGNMGDYCGNIQMGFMTKIKEAPAEKKALIEEPLMTYPALTEADIASWIVEGYTAQKQAINGFSASLHSVTGTLVADSIIDKQGTVVTDIDSMANNRFTFQLQVGSQVMTVAYDYHTDREGAVGLFSALKAALKKGGKMTVKGTMRYSGDDDKLFITEGNEGVWNIVPFLPEHIA
jgi:hypothetical protein